MFEPRGNFMSSFFKLIAKWILDFLVLITLTSKLCSATHIHPISWRSASIGFFHGPSYWPTLEHHCQRWCCWWLRWSLLILAQPNLVCWLQHALRRCWHWRVRQACWRVSIIIFNIQVRGVRIVEDCNGALFLVPSHLWMRLLDSYFMVIIYSCKSLLFG